MNLLVVGQGLLGKSVLRCSADDNVHGFDRIDWQSPGQARQQLADLATSFGRGTNGSWRVAWCAGAGVIGTPSARFAEEQSYLETFLTALRRTAAARPGGSGGGVFLASSAGGVYGAGSSTIITEESDESPTSEYGESKLALEQLVAEWSSDTAVPAMIGRISNLYGPAQNLAKPQGFVSQLLRSMLLRQPFQLRASGDTERDFIHVDDAAARIHAWLLRPGALGVTRKLIACGRSHTLPQVANIARSVTRIQPKIMYAAATGSAPQPHHLRFASRVRTDLDNIAPSRSLEVGIAQTWHVMLHAFASGRFTEHQRDSPRRPAAHLPGHL